MDGLAAADERPGPTTETRLLAFADGRFAPRFDVLATEEPLEIRLRAGGATRTLAVTMRTPGRDVELAAGFLYGEGIIASHADLRGISFCTDRDVAEAQRYNRLTADLAAPSLPDLRGLERRFTTTSACGICGAASLDALRERGCAPLVDDLRLDAALVGALPSRLQEAQEVFRRTGGLHAVGLFDAAGRLVVVREDVGRHNAFDKVVGWALMRRRLPLAGHVVVVSGRASYELVQKAIAARIPVLCAVSAPSSLAVDLARAFDLTLCGFVRASRFNAYAGADRIAATG